MPDEPTGDTGPVEQHGLDIEAASQGIADDLFPAATPSESDHEEGSAAGEGDPAASPPPEEETATSPPARAVPKSWPKEMHEHWEKVPEPVQTYWETREKQMLDGLDQYKTEAQFGKQLREVLTPFQSVIQQAGVNDAQAVQYLLNAHTRLTQGTSEQRMAAYQELGKNLGLVGETGQNGQIDPHLKALQDKVSQMESSLTARQQAELTQARQTAAKEVEAFAADTESHPYFDEVAEETVSFIQSGLSLKDAYEKAVWANPVTRAKELARVQTEQEAKLKERARLDALPKKKAASVNVKSRETQGAPTEPVGTMDDTMRETLAVIKSR